MRILLRSVAGAIGAGALALALVLSSAAAGVEGQAGGSVHPLSCNDGTSNAPQAVGVADPNGGCPGSHNPVP